MIESKEQVMQAFRTSAQAFLAQPGAMTGIDFDDATVTLKRYALTEMHDQDLASLLGGFQKLIRNLDVATLTELIGRVEEKLSA